MLRKAHTLIGNKIHALDGDMGHVADFYFDDQDWTVRYMIVRTGSWFSEKHVMLSPAVIRDLAWDDKTLFVDLTQKQLKNSPDLDLAKPVTREQEMELASYYRWPRYWVGAPAGAIDPVAANMGLAATGVPAMGSVPVGVPTRDAPSHLVNDISSTDIADAGQSNTDITNSGESKVDAELRRAAQATGLDHTLRGVKEVIGYHIEANDGEIGHVEDFFIDEENWQINYLLVDTGNWLPGRKVLIAPDWITDISWSDSQVRVNATREQVKNSPEFDPRGAVDRHYESALYGHYGFPPYWV
jgi:uncharacterized protein YrrD